MQVKWQIDRLGKKQALQNGENEGNNLFSDIELSRYFCSVL